MSVPQCCDYSGFTVSFKIEKCESFKFAFFQDYFYTLWPYERLYEFIMNFSISAKKKASEFL